MKNKTKKLALNKPLNKGDVSGRSEQLKNKIIPKPTYHPASTEGIYSPMLAEREVDDARDGHKRQMQFWWEKLTPKQQREEWYKDGSQLGFYVSKPKYLRKSKLA